MTISLDNKVIVIIGGTSGLGLSAARACIAAGAKVVALGRDDEAAQQADETLGDAGRVLIGDAADPAAAVLAVESAVRTFGRLDGLYHVAGGSGRSKGDGPLHTISDEGVDFTLRINLASVIYSNRAAVRQFMAQNSAHQGCGGSIVNIASVLAFAPAAKFFSTHAYAAAKAAVIGLTQSCAAYYAAHNIRFNAIAPGLVATPMSLRAQGDPQIMAYVAARQPLDGGRIGRPDDCDGAAVYLLSDAAKFTTGQVLSVDGGWSVSEGLAT